MSAYLYLSHRMDSLIDRLIDHLEADPIDPICTRTIVVPNRQIREWILLEIAKKKGVAMGLKVVEIEELVPVSMNSLEMFCSLYSELIHSTDPELIYFVDGKKKRILDLAAQLATLFFSYGQFGKGLFEGSAEGWQQKILHKFFVEGPWRLPVQMKMDAPGPLICFGIDFLPTAYWEFLFRSPELSIYQFSPCAEYWEDLASDRERKKLERYWKKRGVAKKSRDQLDAYLRDAPRHLANWGKIGRETLKIFDRFDLQIEDVYPTLNPDSLLKRIQFDLLTFQETQKIPPDDSVKLFLTGSSRLKEVECLRDEILRLGIPYHEISVLAPDIEPYVPLIEYVFSDRIPYRISGFDIATQSSFRQGLERLLHLASGRWEAEEVLTLFETPSFYRKQQWTPDKLEQFRNWIDSVRIKWGRDEGHRMEILTNTLGNGQYEDQNSWEKGLDRLLDAVIFLLPMQINPDLFEELISILSLLKTLDLKGEKTLFCWAEALEKAARDFLVIDPNDEADMGAQNVFSQLLFDLRKSQNENLFPFEVIQRLLNRPCLGQMHSSHLHAIRFAPLDACAMIPSRALFLIGMDEDSFPRTKTSSSLDLLKGQVPDIADRDRYLFLQALFSAQEFLRISYGHLSADEGKPVGPSLLVQELTSTIDIQTSVYCPPPVPIEKPHLLWSNVSPSLPPQEEQVLSISDLRLLARHPWKFFLQKVHGIYLNEEWEDSFALQKGRLVRASLEKPIQEVFAEEEFLPGTFGEALRLEVSEKAEEWQSQLEEWQLKPFSLTLRDNCTEIQWDGPHCIAPPLQIGAVRLIGEIKLATQKGLVCTNEDHLSGCLKVWPEALIVAMTFNAPQIWMLRNGKSKAIENVEPSLKAFIEYYFLSLKAPSPLLSDWADPFLRKGLVEFEKKMEKGSSFEDPVMDWVLARAQIPNAEELYSNWSPILKETFASLIQLYPTRGKTHAAI